MSGIRVGRLSVVAVTVLVTTTFALSSVVPAAAPGNVTPKAGAWKVRVVQGGSGSGAGGQFTVIHLAFSVSSNHKSVLHFAFSYDWSGPIKPPAGSCSGTGVSVAKKSSAIKNRKFSTPRSTSWSGGGSATFKGVFDSARKAHGTALFSVFITGVGCQFPGPTSSGTVTWRATR